MDGEIESWSWNFGDGSTGSGETTIHSYSAAGNYTVTLTVTDDDGATDSDVTYAKISEAPPVNIAPEISDVTHTPDPVISGDIITITANVNDADGVESVTLYYGNGSIHTNMVKGSGHSYSAEIGPFSKGTLFRYWIVAKDTKSKTNTTEKYSFFVRAPPITEDIGNVTSGELKEVTISDDDIKRIHFKSTVKLENVTIKFEEKYDEELSENVRYNRTGKKVYKYFNLELNSNGTYINESKLESIKMSFIVRKSWIENNSIDNKSISIWRYYNNTWQNLSTYLTLDDEMFIHYEVDTPGFSTFAVVGSEIVGKEPTGQRDEPEIPWIIIIGFIISAIVILLIVLFKGKYIYIEKTEVIEKE